MRISLNGDWTLTYFPEAKGCPGTPDEIVSAGYPSIPALVPGDAVLDLMRAGAAPDPCFGENIYEYRKYEFHRWMYRRSFTVPEGTDRLNLHFGGINTVAEIFVNGISVGSCDNMMIPHDFDITGAVRRGAENDLAVIISSPVNAARKYDFPVRVNGFELSDEMTVLRIPPSCFGWDIMPRLLSAGIWRDCHIESVPADRFTQVYFATVEADALSVNPWARLVCRWRLETDSEDFEGLSLALTLRCGDSVYRKECPVFFVSGEFDMNLDRPLFWWPLGYGGQPLYDTELELRLNGRVIAVRHDRIGIRTLTLEQKSAPGDEGEFLVRANGVPLLLKGSNWVPLDALHSRDAGRYEYALGLFRELGCNILRCWGGNVYEDERFFSLCDEYGILVWHDFAYACALYPQDEAFLRRVHDEAAETIRLRRNHPCLLLWAGDNECDEFAIRTGFAPGFTRYNALTREAIPLAVRENDPYRVYLPSSPYIPDGIAQYDVPEQHNWGDRAWYKDDFYKQTKARFVSECGYHGCPDPASLREFIPENELWPRTSGGAWDTHDTQYLKKGMRYYSRNGLMADQAKLMCGEMPEDLETFAVISQFVQAEADKFFVERTRMKKWRRTGIIWWNMLDGWPQISDAIVDWYGRRKLAFTWLRRVHTPVCVMMDELSGWEHEVVLGNDSRGSGMVSYEISDADSGAVLMSGEAFSPANENVSLGRLRVNPGEKRLFLIRWTFGGKKHSNHYLDGFPPFDKKDILRWVDIIRSMDEDR